MRTLLWGAAALVAVALSGCGDEAGSDDAGDCVSFLTYNGETYFPKTAKDLPEAAETVTARLPDCSENGETDAAQELDVNVLRGVDPAVALADVSGGGGAGPRTLWVAIGDTPEHDIPEAVTDYLAN